MNVEEIEKISMRARVAYSIVCLEKAIEYYELSDLNWDILLNILWSYTSSDYLDDWMSKMARVIPDDFLEFSEYDPEIFEYLKEEELKELQKLYKNTNKEINRIIELIFEIGASEIYCLLAGGMQDNVKYLLELIQEIETIGIELPNKKRFEKFSFFKKGGWGEHFTREELFNSIE